ncbi:site-specific DNA-methyltransferase [Xanthobacter oligotrophicus]|uniref:Methyltransferase n=1 Tax=Xanthobacter oligotrophicus TaxID=2607286 RepID=A0ABW6ZS82_9HYPH
MSAETFLDGRVTLWLGDVRAMLAAMEPDSVDCVVTSPPYWGLRDYGVEGQIGLEPTLGEHLAVMVEVFALVRRVLKPAGTLWINYGDCYAAAPNGRSAADTKAAGNDDRTFRDKPFSTVGPVFVSEYEKTARSGASQNKGHTHAAHGGRVVAGGYLKPKDLCMVPNRLAIALQDDGWWVRSEIIWGKTNPMPDSSGAYRPSTAHEKIFLLAKSDDGEVWRARDTGELSTAPDLSERCALVTDATREANRWVRLGAYYDAESVRQGRTSDEDANGFRGSSYVGGEPGPRQNIGNKVVRGRESYGRHTLGDSVPDGERRDKQRGHSRRHQGFNDRWDAMPKVEQGANGRYLRNYEPAPLAVWPMATKAFSDAHFATFPPDLAGRCIAAGCPPGGLVLDPFGGAGTTALVAARMGRLAALIELNPDYAAMARLRIERDWMGEVESASAKARGLTAANDHGPLFGVAAGKDSQ